MEIIPDIYTQETIEYASIIVYKNKPEHTWISKRVKYDERLEDFFQHWQCPGGHMELGDISARHAAQRELCEETGIKVKMNKLRYIRTDHYYVNNEWRMVHCYHLKTKEKPELTEDGMTEWELKKLWKIPNEPMIDSLRDAFKPTQNEVKVIIIEGTCGAGKTTFVRKCKQYLEGKGRTVEVMDESFITKDPNERLAKY